MLSIHKKRPVRKGVHQLSVLKPNAKVVKTNDIDRADTLYISPKMVNPANSYFEVLGEKAIRKKLTEVN